MVGMDNQLEKLYNLLDSGIPKNIELAFTLQESLGIEWNLEPYFELYSAVYRQPVNRTDMESFKKHYAFIFEDNLDVITLSSYDRCHIHHLNLFPEKVSLFENLEHLYVNGLEAGRTIYNIKELKKLKSITFNNCNLSEIPFFLRTLPQLDIVNFENNNIESIPDWIRETNWEILNVQENPVCLNDPRFSSTSFRRFGNCIVRCFYGGDYQFFS